MRAETATARLRVLAAPPPAEMLLCRGLLRGVVALGLANTSEENDALGNVYS